MTVLFSVIAVFVLPDFPGNTAWLSEEERSYAVARLVADNNTDDASDEAVGYWQSFVMACRDWRTWLFCFGQSTNTAAGTITYFVPTLMTALGYSGRQAQFVSVNHDAKLMKDDGAYLRCRPRYRTGHLLLIRLPPGTPQAHHGSRGTVCGLPGNCRWCKARRSRPIRLFGIW